MPYFVDYNVGHGWTVVAHAFNPSTCEAEAGRSLKNKTKMLNFLVLTTVL